MTREDKEKITMLIDLVEEKEKSMEVRIELIEFLYSLYKRL